MSFFFAAGQFSHSQEASQAVQTGKERVAIPILDTDFYISILLLFDLFPNLNAAKIDSVWPTRVSRAHGSECTEERLRMSCNVVVELTPSAVSVVWVLHLDCELLNLATEVLVG